MFWPVVASLAVGAFAAWVYGGARPVWRRRGKGRTMPDGKHLDGRTAHAEMLGSAPVTATKRARRAGKSTQILTLLGLARPNGGGST